MLLALSVLSAFSVLSSLSVLSVLSALSELVQNCGILKYGQKCAIVKLGEFGMVWYALIKIQKLNCAHLIEIWGLSR